MNIAILTNGCYKMGTGHIFRQMNLTKALQGIHAISFYVNKDKNIQKLLKENHVFYKVVASDFDFINELSHNKYDLLIIDKLNNSKEDIKRYKQYVSKILSFDDQGTGVSEIDYLINAIVPVTSAGKKVYTGKDYMIFSQNTEFYANKIKKISEKINRILISFGGSDANDYTLSLKNFIANQKDIKFDLVIGSNYNNKELITKIYCDYSNVNLIIGKSDIAEFIYKSDLCLISGGLTLYEATYIGTPSFVLCQIEHQIETANYFEINNCCKSFEILSDVELISKQMNIFSAKAVRQKMHNSQRDFIKSNGIYNIIDLINSIKT